MSDVLEHTVTGAGGVNLAVREHRPTNEQGHGPTVVFVHGYPDNQRVWDLVAQRLADSHHVVTYDVRGAGKSDKPTARQDYRMRNLVADFKAVADAVSPDHPVHLVGHDWGSIQSWAAVTDPDVQQRIASYTSISGPSLDHVGQWMKTRMRPGKATASVRGDHPVRHAGDSRSFGGRIKQGRLRQLASQGIHSWYVYAFHTPLAPWVWRKGLAKVWPDIVERGEHALVDEHWPGPTLADDAARGVLLYRANMFQTVFKAGLEPGDVHTDVPVQLLVPTGDSFVTPALLDGIENIAPNLVRRSVGGKHWLPRSKPDQLARLVRDHVARVEAGEAIDPDAGKPDVVVVTGAGSGIGRSVCLAFAERGAHIVATDINPDRAGETAELCRLLGTTAESHRVDVTDADGMTAFAERVHHDHGAATVVVNNAGIGMAGSFVDTTDKDWQQLRDINLWGVIRGSRLFAKQMIDNGTPGHIVNTASAAAFTPSRTLPAYATSKAAVLMLTECLRAELADDGVGVSAICPGFVDTGIATATRYVGVDDTEQSARRQVADRMYKRRRVFPDTVADAVLRAVDKNKAVVPVGAVARLGLFASRFTPHLRRALAKVDLTPRAPRNAVTPEES